MGEILTDRKRRWGDLSQKTGAKVLVLSDMTATPEVTALAGCTWQ